MTTNQPATNQPHTAGIRLIPLLDVLNQAVNWNAVCEWLCVHADDARCRMYWKVPSTAYFVRRGDPPMHFGYAAPVDPPDLRSLPPVGAPMFGVEYLRLDPKDTRQVAQQAHSDGTNTRLPVWADRFRGGLRVVGGTPDLGGTYSELYPVELYISALDRGNGNARAAAELYFTDVYTDDQTCDAISNLLVSSPNGGDGGAATDDVGTASNEMAKQFSQTNHAVGGSPAVPVNTNDPDKGQLPEGKSPAETRPSSAVVDDDSDMHVHSNDAIVERGEPPTSQDHPSGSAPHFSGGNAAATASSDTHIYASNQQTLRVQVFVNNLIAPLSSNPNVEPPSAHGKGADAESHGRDSSPADATRSPTNETEAPTGGAAPQGQSTQRADGSGVSRNDATSTSTSTATQGPGLPSPPKAMQTSAEANPDATAATSEDDPYELKGKADAVYALYWVAHGCSADPNYKSGPGPKARKVRKKIASRLLATFIDNNPTLRAPFDKTRMEQAEKYIDPERDPNAGLHSDTKKRAWPTPAARAILMDNDPRRPEFMERRAGEEHLPELATLLLIIDATKQWLGWAKTPPASGKPRTVALDDLLTTYRLNGLAERRTLFPFITWGGSRFVPAPKPPAKSTSQRRKIGARHALRRRV